MLQSPGQQAASDISAMPMHLGFQFRVCFLFHGTVWGSSSEASELGLRVESLESMRRSRAYLDLTSSAIMLQTSPSFLESIEGTREDFECEIGFEREIDSKNCRKSEFPWVGAVEEQPAQCSLAACPETPELGWLSSYHEVVMILVVSNSLQQCSHGSPSRSVIPHVRPKRWLLLTPRQAAEARFRIPTLSTCIGGYLGPAASS